MKVMLLLPALPLKRSSNDARWVQSLAKDKPGYVTQPAVLLTLVSVTPPDVEVILGDLTIDDEDALFARAEREGVELVGISAYTSTAPSAYRLAARARAMGAKTVLGGVHPTLLPDEAKQHCDAVVVGEAEETWPRLLEDLRRGELQPFYRADPLPDMSRFAPVFAENIDRDRYSAYMLETTRGCPFSCNFCTIPEVNGNKMRTKGEAAIEAELRFVAKAIHEDENNHFILCVDSNFYGNRPHMHRVLKLMIRLREEGVELPHMLVATSINTMRDPENLELLAKAGVRQVYIGFESTELESLRAALKLHHRNVDYDEVVAKMRAHGIAVQASFIIGHDSDSDRYIDSIVDFCDRNGIVFPELNILTPLPGSQLFALMKSQGRVLHERWQEYTCQDAVYQPSGRYSDPLDVEAAYVEALERLADPARLWRAFKQSERLMPPDAPYVEIGAAASRPSFVVHRSVRDRPDGRFTLLDRVYTALFILYCIPRITRAEIGLALRMALWFLFHPVSMHTQSNMGMMFDYRDFVRQETARLREKASRRRSESPVAAPAAAA